MESIKLKHVDKIKFALDSKNLLKNFSYMPGATAKGTAVLTVRTWLKKGHRNYTDPGWFYL